MSRPLPVIQTFPAEIFELIALHIGDEYSTRKTYRSCSLVCKSFNDGFHPVVFKNVTIFQSTHLPKLLDILHSNPTIGRYYIRKLTCCIGDGSNSQPTVTDFEQTISSILLYMHNIQELRLESRSTPSLYYLGADGGAVYVALDHVLTLPSLEKVVISGTVGLVPRILFNRDMTAKVLDITERRNGVVSPLQLLHHLHLQTVNLEYLTYRGTDEHVHHLLQSYESLIPHLSKTTHASTAAGDDASLEMKLILSWYCTNTQTCSQKAMFFDHLCDGIRRLSKDVPHENIPYLDLFICCSPITCALRQRAEAVGYDVEPEPGKSRMGHYRVVFGSRGRQR